MSQIDLLLPALIGSLLVFFPQIFFKPRMLVLNYDRKIKTVRRVGFLVLALTAVGLLLIRFPVR